MSQCTSGRQLSRQPVGRHDRRRRYRGLRHDQPEHRRQRRHDRRYRRRWRPPLGGRPPRQHRRLHRTGIGVFVVASAGTITNGGTIAATVNGGVDLVAGGSVGNSGTGLIQGRWGVVIAGGAGTVSNAATIVGTAYGVDFDAGGSVGNTGTSLIQGGTYGVLINN